MRNSLRITSNSSSRANRPREHPFLQQKTKAWQPTLSINHVFPYFLITGIVCVPLGIILLKASSDVKEYKLDYTDCKDGNGVMCRDLRRNVTAMNVNCTCSHQLNIDTLIEGNIFFFYGLTQFNQNHRKYGWSRSDIQLNGQSVTEKKQVSECLPYDGEYVNGTWKNYAPCGMVANSLFNDTFYMTSANGSAVPMTRSGIAWPSDVRTKFKNPEPDNCEPEDDACKNNLTAAFEPYTKPSWWSKPAQDIGDTDEGQGYENEPLMVWMQVAAFPNFRKKYARVMDGVSLHGNYTLTIQYNYPVSYNVIEGRKTFIVTNVGWMGQKNVFLGVAYVLLGLVCILISIVSAILQYSAVKQVISVKQVRTDYKEPCDTEWKPRISSTL